jgi:uncharacterized RDD family membrane protein YckC
MNETLQIDTPENVVFGYTVAGIGSRFMAALVDSVVIVLLEALAYLLMYLIFFSTGNAHWSTWLVAVFSLVGFLFLWGYYLFFELLWNGQSLGKRWVGLRVIRSDGMPITLSESLVRNVIRLVDFLPVAYGVGLVSMFIGSQSRRLGDLAAGTLVIYDRGSVPMPVLPAMPAVPLVPRLQPVDQPNATLPPAALPVHLLSNQDIILVQEFYSRQSEIVEREKLAAQILAQLYRRMGLPDQEIQPGTASAHLIEILAAIRDAKDGHSA